MAVSNSSALHHSRKQLHLLFNILFQLCCHLVFKTRALFQWDHFCFKRKKKWGTKSCVQFFFHTDSSEEGVCKNQFLCSRCSRRVLGYVTIRLPYLTRFGKSGLFVPFFLTLCSRIQAPFALLREGSFAKISIFQLSINTDHLHEHYDHFQSNAAIFFST